MIELENQLLLYFAELICCIPTPNRDFSHFFTCKYSLEDGEELTEVRIKSVVLNFPLSIVFDQPGIHYYYLYLGRVAKYLIASVCSHQYLILKQTLLSGSNINFFILNPPGMRKEWTHSLNFWCLNPAVVSYYISS